MNKTNNKIKEELGITPESEYEERVENLEHGLALLLKSSRKDLSIRDMATILALVLDSSEIEEFIKELRKEKESIEE